MDLKALNYFIAVYETGSFSAASKRQFIAQPSISASVKQLESELSQPLFTRFSRGVTPTEAGHQLYPLARQLVGQAGAIKDLFSDNDKKTPFRLGLIKGLGVDKMSGLLKRFTSAVESMELTLVPSREPSDARIISNDMLGSEETFIPMWQERYLLVIPASHPLRLKEDISLCDLKGLPFIQRSPCEGWEKLRELMTTAQIDVDVRARIQTVEYALGLVGAGLGCAFIPVSEQQVQETELIFRALPELSMVRNIGLAFKDKSDITDILTAIVKDT